jgi:hypothetical protein
MGNREKGNMFKLLTAIAVLIVPWLAKGDTLYNLDQLTPLEQELQPLIYDVFSVRYFGVDPVYTQIPAQAVKLWDKTRSFPTHPLDFVITYIKASASVQNSLAVHCAGRLTLIDESGDGHITGSIYAEWDLAFATTGSWPMQPAADPGAKPVLTAFDESSNKDFAKEYPGR